MEHKMQMNTSAEEFKVCNGVLNDECLDKLWMSVKMAAEEVIVNEPQLRHLLEDVVTSRNGLAESLAARLSRKLAGEDMQRNELEPLLLETLTKNGKLVRSAARDMQAIVDRDPACKSALEPLLFYKGFLALTAYRVAHHMWVSDRRVLALYFQSISSEIFAVDIHPAARIGCGILLDHATSLVIGETSIVEDNVSILHEVTLGGTGKEAGNRHPVVRSGVLLGAGAKILGRVTIGECAKVGAGSVVLEDVMAHTTVAGVPAVVMGQSGEENPALGMNQTLCDGWQI